MLHELVLSPGVASGDQALPLEPLLAFVASCARSPSTTVRTLARCCMDALASVPSLSEDQAAAVAACLSSAGVAQGQKV